MRYGLPHATKEIHPSFESLVVIGSPGSQDFFMDIHHDTSFRSILEDDSISSTSRIRICSCLGKGIGLWLISKLSIHSFHIAHFTFTSSLCFHLDLIQPSTSNFFTCERGHVFDTLGTHLTCCLFGNRWIATHDVIRNIMYTLAQKNGHIVWKERWYTLISRVSLQIDFYMT